MDHEDDIRARIQAANEIRRKAPPTARIRFGADGRPFLDDVGLSRFARDERKSMRGPKLSKNAARAITRTRESNRHNRFMRDQDFGG